ncbi:MAG: hypothetical protein WBA41_13855 [Rivularia sp. (in: cyanobacteria)]
MIFKQVKFAALGLVAASAILPGASPASALLSKTAQQSVAEIQTELPQEELFARRYRVRRRVRRRVSDRPRRVRVIRRQVRDRRRRRPVRVIRRRTCYRTRRYRTRNGYRYKTVCRYRTYRR